MKLTVQSTPNNFSMKCLILAFTSPLISIQYTGWPKKLTHFVLYVLTSSNIDQFLNLFHCQHQENNCNNTVIIDPTTPQVCHYTTL